MQHLLGYAITQRCTQKASEEHCLDKNYDKELLF
jgi:hypothetical protein